MKINAKTREENKGQLLTKLKEYTFMSIIIKFIEWIKNLRKVDIDGLE